METMRLELVTLCEHGEAEPHHLNKIDRCPGGTRTIVANLDGAEIRYVSDDWGKPDPKRRLLLVPLPDKETPCEHEWVDARNRFVSSGEWCPKCNAIRAEAEKPTCPHGRDSDCDAPTHGSGRDCEGGFRMRVWRGLGGSGT